MWLIFTLSEILKDFFPLILRSVQETKILSIYPNIIIILVIFMIRWSYQIYTPMEEHSFVVSV